MPSLRRFRAFILAAAALASALAVLVVAPAAAQTVTSGAIGGVATDTAAVPLAGATVTLTHHATGWSRVVLTDINGAYRSRALPPGSYDVRFEQLGYRPVLVLDVTVSPAVAVTLDARLTPADPPVTQVDTSAYVEGALHASLARGTWDPGTEIPDIADPQGRLGTLASLASISPAGLGIEGLPDRMGSVGVDGIPRTAAASPGVSSTDLSTLGMPFVGLDHAEVASGTDAEWPGFGGGLLSSFSVRAPRNGQARGYGDVEGGSYRGGVVLGGPVVRDTAWALVGVDARRLETRFPAQWPSDSASAAAVKLAQDSGGTDLSRYLSKRTSTSDLLTVFGRFDWQVADGQSLALRASVTNLSATDPSLGVERPLALGSSLDARDVSVSARLDTRLSSTLSGLLSLAVDRSLRDYGASSLPGLVVTTDGLAGGTDAALPGRFERNEVRGTGALLLRAGAHELKAGLTIASTSHDITYDPYQDGVFYFGGATPLEQGQGAFVQSVGEVPAASFTISTTGVFAQDSWTPLSGLNLLYGLRIDGQTWPRGGVAQDAQWQQLSGLPNQVVPRLKTQVAPRVAFTWSAGPQREWLLRGDAGVFAEGVDPAVLAEVLTHDGASLMRRGVGTIGAWPGVPDSSAAPVAGPALTIINPGFQAPRTDRAGLSVAREMGAGTSLQVVGQYRHTDFLPRRSDLNLATGSQVTDQFGRPVYGTLRQIGGVLAATPGSNRRFSTFDQVFALDPTGFSDYWGVTVALERVREQGLSFWASYTYSRTTDNTPGLAGSLPEAQLSPFPAAAGDWRNGVSDLDVPHRAALGAALAVGPIRLAAVVRYQSGAPFTPGFRPGVDANGDGAAGNDPAFVTDSVSGAAAVVGRSSCLKQQLGTFASRNSCRAPAVTSLDARFEVRLFGLSGAPVELIVDGLNLITTNQGVVDNALYLVDPSKTLTTSASGAVVTVPLVANPNFGKLLYKLSPALGVRAGLRFSF